MVDMLFFDATDDKYVDELTAYVAVPSVSRDASEETMRTAAEWLAAQLAFAGGRVVATEGHPVVRADWLGAPDAPTIL
ncbi:MAG: putative peptidase, partial [Actinoallomurus sp.]|nr:putative peptidase [Actinoallomurus sp.]